MEVVSQKKYFFELMSQAGRDRHNPPKEHLHYSGFQNSGVQMLTAFSEDHSTKNGDSLDEGPRTVGDTQTVTSLPFSYSLGF